MSMRYTLRDSALPRWLGGMCAMTSSSRHCSMVKSPNQQGTDSHTTPRNSRSMRLGPPSSRSPERSSNTPWCWWKSTSPNSPLKRAGSCSGPSMGPAKLAPRTAEHPGNPAARRSHRRVARRESRNVRIFRTEHRHDHTHDAPQLDRHQALRRPQFQGPVQGHPDLQACAFDGHEAQVEEGKALAEGGKSLGRG